MYIYTNCFFTHSSLQTSTIETAINSNNDNVSFTSYPSFAFVFQHINYFITSVNPSCPIPHCFLPSVNRPLPKIQRYSLVAGCSVTPFLKKA